MQKVLAIAAAGAVGTLARYWLGGMVQRALGPGFPWGTAAVNIIGCFAFGLIFSAADERGLLSPDLRLVLLVGFLGAFTTFSTFIAESGQMLAGRELMFSLGNVAFQVIVGLIVFFVGQYLGRSI